jgi:hypothetical protein
MRGSRQQGAWIMLTAQSRHSRLFAATLVVSSLGFLAPTFCAAVPPDGVIPITAEPDHKIRLDNGTVRVIEVVLPKGKATLFHEHLYDAFFIFFRNSEITNEPFRGKPVANRTPVGSVSFTSTASGPYSHRVIASGDETVHVIATELVKPPAAAGSENASEIRFPPFEVALESARGRIYRLRLNPGESVDEFTRPAGTLLFAVSSGRISEKPEGKPVRLWDFEPGRFRLAEATEALTLKNESAGPIDLVEIEVF